MRTRRFELLRPAEIVAEMRARPLIFLPLGPLEWHGPHLPLGTDPLIAHGVALAVAERVGGVVLPPFFWGSERENLPEDLRSLGFKGDEWIVGMDFPANSLKSLYVREEFFALLVREALTLLIEQGYRLIVIVNGHGGENHIKALDRLSAEFTARGPAVVRTFIAWASPGDVLDVGHADDHETSRMMHLHPETVDLSTLPPPEVPLKNVEYAIVDYLTFRGQPTPDHTTRHDPRIGTSPENGRAEIELSADLIAAHVAEDLHRLSHRTAQARVNPPAIDTG
jgi:creatinine amidohydrolase